MAEQTNQSQADTDAAVEQALSEAQASLDAMQEAVQQQEQESAAGGSAASPDAAAGIGGGDLLVDGDGSGIDLLGDVDLQVMIELGRTEMLVEDVLRLGNGSVVELDKLAGDPVDVYVNNRLVARGEVLVLNDNFCIRVSEIVANLEEQVEAAAEEQREQ